MRWIFRLFLATTPLLGSLECQVPAQTWTQTSAATNSWVAVACSADGEQLVAAASSGLIYLSTDFGTNWSPTSAPAKGWASLCSSADGTTLAACAEAVYVSNDSGSSWYPTLNSAPLNSISCSADGEKLFAVGGAGFAFTSVDGGATWSNMSLTVTPVGFRFLSAASSADGNTTAITSYGSGSIFIEVHTNLWAGFSSFLSQAFLRDGFTASVASSADGNKLSVYNNSEPAITPGGRLYTSADAGSNWNATIVPVTNFSAIASSADGTHLVAVSKGDTFYTSVNSGTNWIPVNVPATNWASVASSADGNKVVAVVNGGGIYTIQTKPAPSLEILPSIGGLLISWIIPSQSFVLQQTSDLGKPNWTNVQGTPALNLTNLHNEVTIATPPGQMFYRLASQ